MANKIEILAEYGLIGLEVSEGLAWFGMVSRRTRALGLAEGKRRQMTDPTGMLANGPDGPWMSNGSPRGCLPFWRKKRSCQRSWLW